MNHSRLPLRRQRLSGPRRRHVRKLGIPLLRAVLFDLGDTLVHLDRPREEVFQASLEAIYSHLTQLGLRADFHRFAKTYVRMFEDASATCSLYKIEIPLPDIIARTLRKHKFGNLEQDLIQRAMEEYYRPEIEAWQVYPDTVDTLVALRDGGFEMGLISNAQSDYAVRTILRKFDLEKFFKVILSSAALRLRKPRAEVFLRALDALNVKPSQTVFVGDSIDADIIGARALGMRALHLLRRPIGKIDHDATVTSLTEALARITSWQNASLAKTTRFP